MVTINCAYTEAINPKGATPVLSREQIWKGLQIKIRKAQLFVPIIERCDVIEEKQGGEDGKEDGKNNIVVREAHFRQGADGAPAHSVREVCRSFYPCKVDFHQPNGAVITNTISDGADQDDASLMMTYTFEWRYPDMVEGSDEHGTLLRQSRDGAKMAVSKSIEAMRRMALKGELD